MPYPTVGQVAGGGLYGGGALPNQPQAPQAPLTPEQQAMAMMMATQGKYQVDPALIKHAALTSQQGLETGQLDRSMKLAEALRGDASEQVKGVQAGRRFVAPGALSALAGLSSGLLSGYMSGDIQKRRKEMVGEGQTGALDIMNAINAGR